MTRVNADMASPELSRLLDAVLGGEEIEILRAGKPVARLVSISRSGPDEAGVPVPSSSLRDDPAIGMWADREDMQDTHAWLRQLRDREWHRG